MHFLREFMLSVFLLGIGNGHWCENLRTISEQRKGRKYRSMYPPATYSNATIECLSHTIDLTLPPNPRKTTLCTRKGWRTHRSHPFIEKKGRNLLQCKGTPHVIDGFKQNPWSLCGWVEGGREGEGKFPHHFKQKKNQKQYVDNP